MIMSFISHLSTLILILCAQDLRASPLSRRSLAVDVSNEFAVNLLHLLETEDNTFLSPFGLTATVMTLMNGAKGETERELREVLNLDGNGTGNGNSYGTESELNAQMKTLFDSLTSMNSRDMSVRLLAKMLINSDIAGLKDSFVRLVKDNYKTVVKAENFQKNSKAITKSMNEWVIKETNNEIRGLYKQSVDPHSTVVLANAVHFSGKWKHSFDTNLTEKQEFFNFMAHHMSGLPTPVDFMTKEDILRIIPVPELRSQMVELPYSSHISMLIILPNTESDLKGLNENLNVSVLHRAFNELQQSKPQVVQLTMPKFKIETDYNLMEVLEDFDVKTLWTSKADLSAGVGSKAHVSEAILRASITVDEKGMNDGSEEVDLKSMTTETPEKWNKTTVIINRPFVFLIRDQDSGLIVFIGRVTNLVESIATNFMCISCNFVQKKT